MKSNNRNYVILDSNAFIYALNKNETILPITKIINLAKEQEAYIVISAYSLYELIQNINTIEQIRKFRQQLIGLGDFYVLNTESILEHDFLEYGIDFLFILNLHQDEYMVKYAEERNIIRKKVYDSLFSKFFFYSVLVTSTYLYMTYCDNDGKCDKDTFWKIKYINDIFFKKYMDRYRLIFSEHYKHAGLICYDPNSGEFYKDSNAKDYLRDLILNLVVEMISVSDVELQLTKKEFKYDAGEYNGRIVDNCRKYSKLIKAETFSQINRKCSKRTNNKVNVDYVLRELLFESPESLKKDSYIYLVKRLFVSSGFGKTLNNDFIDFSNMILIEKFQVGQAIYITTDKPWQDFLFQHKDNDYVAPTINFYKQLGLV